MIMLTDDICVRQLLHHFDTLHRPLTYMQNEHVHREGFSTFMSTLLPLFHVTATAQWLWVAVLIAQYCIIVMRHAGGKGMEPRSGKGQAHTYVLAFTQKLVHTVCSTTSTHRAQTCRQAYYVRTYTPRHLLIQKAALYTLSTRAVLVGEEIHSGTLDGKLFIWSQYLSFTF